MGQTYTWHQGNIPVNPKWLLTTPLQPNEIFSSWIIRLALKNGVSPLAIAAYFWPRKRIWTSDIDRGISVEQLKELAVQTGLVSQKIRLSFLDNIFIDKITNELPVHGSWPWLLPLGCRNLRRSIATQYCPICFSTDRAPYIRLSWRFAWHTCCEHHHVKLQQTCQQCGAYFLPHKLTPDATSLACCYLCKTNLTTHNLSTSCNPSALKMQNILDETLHNGIGMLGKRITCTSLDYFTVTHLLLQVIRKANNSPESSLSQIVFKELGSTPKVSDLNEGIAYEASNFTLREQLMAQCYHVFVLRFDEFFVECSKAKLNLTSLFDSRQVIPSLLEQLLFDLPASKKKYKKNRLNKNLRPKSKIAVQRKWMRLLRKYHMKKQ